MRITLTSTLLAAFSSHASAHGAHVENIGGHSHMSAVVALVAFACIGAFVIKQRAK